MTMKEEFTAIDMATAAADGFLAGQRAAQSAGAPDVSAMARVLSDRSADACNIDRTDNWAMYGQEYIEDVQAMLAAPAQPAAQGEFGDAYQGAREDLAIWKRRALEAEARVRQQDQIIDQMGEDLNAINGPTFMGEPVIPAAQDQGEVQILREAPVVVATAILGGLFHGGSGPELGEIDIEVCTPALEELQCETVNSSDDVFLPLMTVAQHQRIVAALRAQQAAHVSVPRELLERLVRATGTVYQMSSGAKSVMAPEYAKTHEEGRALLASHGRGEA